VDRKIEPISVIEGKVFINGFECFDSVKFEIKFTPRVWTGKQLGMKTDSHRWLGYSITGTITRRRSTDWLKQVITKYTKDTITPNFIIQGIANDRGSDYFKSHGTDVLTAVGCVFTGDINLMLLDSGGDVLDDVITFSAQDIV